MHSALLSAAQERQWREDGFLIQRQLFSPAEVGILSRVARVDPEVTEARCSSAKQIKLWGSLRLNGSVEYDDQFAGSVYAAFAAQERLVRPVEQLLGPVEHYHHKLIMKEDFDETQTTGTWEWHQDYGYWYSRYLRPDLASCYIAIDASTRENGALTVLRGSHLAGRIEHEDVRGQPGGNPARVALLESQLEPVVCELSPGDVLMFHCNLLHHSAPNHTPNPRWALIACYCAVDNPCIVPLLDGSGEDEGERKLPRPAVECVKEAAILTVGERQLRHFEGLHLRSRM